MASKDRVRVGNAGGYWGDDLHALRRQLVGGPLDYITQDFLAEITMSILQKQRARDPTRGYAVDFLDQMGDCLPLLVELGTRLISNAGGINPRGCAEAVSEIARQKGLRLSIAVVEGDDLMDRLGELQSRGVSLQNMETGGQFSRIRDRVQSANAYLGAAPVVQALDQGAQIVITGRVTDTGITAAPPAFEFGWSLDDWDRLASAVIAGHILECGAQATGGNLTDWDEVPSFVEMGYPVAEFSSDGSFVVTRHAATGGLVNRKTVLSQLVYEMGDPRQYMTPDVVADFTSLALEETGPERVRVSGARGRPRPHQLKVSISYSEGFKAHGLLVVSRPRAVDKCRRIARDFWKRLGSSFDETLTELVGVDSCHGPLAPPTDPPEILLRLGVRDPDRLKVEEFSRAFTALILSSVSGVAIVGSRPRVQEVVAYWPCLIPASEITPQVMVLDTGLVYAVPWEPPPVAGKEPASGASRKPRETPAEPTAFSGEFRSVPLIQLCYGRSGDKGDTANIGLVARSERVYAWLRDYLTAERVKEHFGHLCKGPVLRYEVPNLLALNFLLERSLGGGGTVSLRIDPQGKTLAEALLMMSVDAPAELLPRDAAH